MTFTQDDELTSAPDRPERPRLRRGPLLIVAVFAALGLTAICLFPLPAALRTSVPTGIVFAVLGLAMLDTAGAVLARPTVRHAWRAASVAALIAVGWALTRLTGLVTPDPWAPMDSVIGFTDYLAAGLAVFTAVVLAFLAARGPRPAGPRWRRLLAGLGVAPVAFVVAIVVLVGFLGAGDWFAGTGFPGAVAPHNLPAGQRSTVEYCRPDGVRLAMDVYPPRANTGGRAPVALYVHGGGLILGDRKTTGVGAGLADQSGALFGPLQRQLNADGFVVASIDYRLPPAAPWPAQIDDVRCAVRFLRAHAADLGIDPHRITAWGSSAGGLLVSLLGLTGGTTPAGGQYADQSDAVSAVVDMFGPADLTNLTGSEAVMRVMVSIGLGGSTDVRRAASPIDHVRPGAPPFLILQGTEDTDVPPWQSETFADRLRAAHVPVTLVIVQGAGHSLVTPGQHPSPDELTATVAGFLTTATGRS